MGDAPIGYINRVREHGREYIAPKASQLIIMQWVFEKIEAGLRNTEQIWKEARKKCLKGKELLLADDTEAVNFKAIKKKPKNRSKCLWIN